MKYLNYGLAVGALVAAGVLGTSAKAELIFQGHFDIGGAGLGNVDTIMTFTSKANGTEESGRISWNGLADVLTPDPTGMGGPLTGGAFTATGSTDFNGINHTITLSSTGWVHGDNLGIIFNPVEPGSAQNIVLNQLRMTIYDATTGAVEFTAPWTGGPLTLLGDPGVGNAGYLFSLDQTETNELNAVATLGGNDRIGLFAYASDATGGHETFFSTVIADPPTYVPAPGNTLGLLGIGMIGTVCAVRWTGHRKNDGPVAA
jgi:hypothetical protein